MSRIIASFNSVSLVWTLRSSSLLKRRCRPIHPSVRSTIQHHGLTTNPWTWGIGLMISTRQAPSVAHQVASGSPTIGAIRPDQLQPRLQRLEPDPQSSCPYLIGGIRRRDINGQQQPERVH